MASADRNVLGMVGLVCSVVGLCTGGVLSPIGLVISLVALMSAPRGMAIAGVIIGLIGSIGVIVLVIVLGGLAAAFAAVAAVASGGQGAGGGGAGGGQPQAPIVARGLGAPDELWARFQPQVELIERRIDAFVQAHAGALPAALADVPGLTAADLTDPWGRAVGYRVIDKRTYELRSEGPSTTVMSDDLSRVVTLGPPAPVPVPVPGPVPGGPR